MRSNKCDDDDDVIASHQQLGIISRGPDSTNSNHVEGVLGSRGRYAMVHNEPSRIALQATRSERGPAIMNDS